MKDILGPANFVLCREDVLSLEVKMYQNYSRKVYFGSLRECPL